MSAGQAPSSYPENQAFSFTGAATLRSFTYAVAPNTRYSVQIGADRTPPCENVFPTVWSTIHTENCTTPPAGRSGFNLKNIWLTSCAVSS